MAKKNSTAPRGPFPEYKTLGPAIKDTNDLLFSMITGGKCLGYQKLSVGDAAVGLTVPEGALYCQLIQEVDPTYADSKLVITRFRQDGVNPTTENGMPLGQNGVVEIKGPDNMKKFRVISATNPGYTHPISIEYYG